MKLFIFNNSLELFQMDKIYLNNFELKTEIKKDFGIE